MRIFSFFMLLRLFLQVFYECVEQFGEVIFEYNRSSFGVEETVGRCGMADESISDGHDVVEFEFEFAHFGDGDPDVDDVGKGGGVFVLAGDGDDG